MCVCVFLMQPYQLLIALNAISCNENVSPWLRMFDLQGLPINAHFPEEIVNSINMRAYFTEFMAFQLVRKIPNRKI